MSDWKAKPAPPAEPYVRGDYSCNLSGPHDPHMWIDTTKRRPVSCPGTPDPDVTECPSCHAAAGRPHTEYCPDRYRGEPVNRPKRIQRRRTKGWRMPENAVYVGRPTKWGNDWAIGDPSPWGDHHPLGRAEAVEVYRHCIDTSIGRHMARTELAGKDLACWCPEGQPCHADVLLHLANEETP